MTLRFDKTPVAGEANKKEIHIRISSTNGARYQVFQKVLEPMMDEQGNVLNLQAVSTETLPNSNASGTLYLQNSDHLSMGDQLVYSSSQSGENDGFIIGYVVDPNLVNGTGTFRGRLTFTVRAQDGSTDEASVDVFLQTSPSLKATVKGGHSLNAVHVHATDTTQNTADFVNISFSGNSGQSIRVYQEVDTFPQNESDEELGTNVLELDAQGQTEGLRMNGPSSLGRNRILVYSSEKIRR